MNCPQCAGQLHSSAPSCCHCGFSIHSVREWLGGDWVRLERITDPGYLLPLAQKKRLEECLDEFERGFPQCFLAVYLGCLPQVLTPAAMGFWLVNHGAFHTSQVAKRNDFGLAWVIDPRRQESAMTVGYALEPLLPSAQLHRGLTSVAQYLTEGRYDRAAEFLVGRISGALTKCGRLVSAPHEVLMPELDHLGLHRLRQVSKSARIPSQ